MKVVMIVGQRMVERWGKIRSTGCPPKKVTFALKITFSIPKYSFTITIWKHINVSFETYLVLLLLVLLLNDYNVLKLNKVDKY